MVIKTKKDMKKNMLMLLSFGLLIISCKTEKETKKEVVVAEKKELQSITEILETATLYEANIRQYSPEGTIAAFTKDIPKLKALGIDIIWTMPIHPIGVKKRKGELGSYYSIQDYKAINPEFGSIADFKEMLKVAHDNGMYIILDWVANHTSWDHDWVTTHPDYYTKNNKGEMIAPHDWTDVAELDFDNLELHKAMIADMKFWVDLGVDGFRCDVASEVPTVFWEKATKELQVDKPLLMLAEAESPELLENAFDMQYGWETHHIMNRIASGEQTVKAWDDHVLKMDSLLQKDDFHMNFTTNHDENSWNGTVKERMGESGELFAAMSYIIPGMPLIYSGQEYDMEHRLSFFGKDTIPKTKKKYFDLYVKLNALKENNKALHGAKNAASYTRIATSEDEKVLAFSRKKDGDEVVFIGNMTNKEVEVTLGDFSGVFKDYLNNSEITLLKGETVKLKPWQHYVLVAE